MHFRILKKDLKRKKTMNIILLIFIVLASTFISSSVNNLIAITTAMDHFIEKADISDYIILAIQEDQNDRAIMDFLNDNEYVESWAEDKNLFATNDNIKLSDKNNIKMANTALISSYNIKQQKFFDSRNREITQINEGEIYLPNKLMENNDLKPGDVITITNGDLAMDFTIKDSSKDAMMGSTMMGTTRFIISDSDYKKLETATDYVVGSMYSVRTGDLASFKKDFNQMGFNFIVACDKSLISFSYIMDMMIAGILMVVSICLILIALVILRFTIIFTLNEEFRQIGIMKAIGIKSRSIRSLYIIKYLAISVIGAFAGFALGIPFGNMFLKQVSKNIILSEGATGLMISFLCSALIVGIVILFCYSSTGRVNKFSPIDAIRNGSNGERFKRKGLLNLYKCNLPAVFFMALNDILSDIRKFSILIITFSIGIILIIEPVNSINTLKSDNLVTLFSMVKSDVYMVNEDNLMKFRENGRDYLQDNLKEMEDALAENDMPSSASCEMQFKYKISLNDSCFISLAVQGTGTTSDQYTYTRGQPPKYANEVALTHIVADKIDAKIGDTVKIKTGEEEKEFTVTALYQAMNNLGEGIRFSEKAELNFYNAIGISAIQIRFSDNPSDQEIKNRFSKIKELYPDYKIETGREYMEYMTGDVAGQLEGVKHLVVVVIIMINLLVVVLMGKTFITKEKGEIGMLKSLGFRNTSIVKWQVIRIGIILIISTVLGTLLSNPVSRISTGKIFEMMGASRIEFVIKPLEVYVLYPVIVFLFTMAASILTALQVRNITVQETNNIE